MAIIFSSTLHETCRYPLDEIEKDCWELEKIRGNSTDNIKTFNAQLILRGVALLMQLL